MGYSPRGHKKSDTTEWLNNNKQIIIYLLLNLPQICSLRASSTWLLSRLAMLPSYSKHFFYFVAPQGIPGPSCTLPESALNLATSPRNPDSFLWITELWCQDITLGVTLFLAPLSGPNSEIHVWILAHVDTSRFISVFLYARDFIDLSPLPSLFLLLNLSYPSLFF